MVRPADAQRAGGALEGRELERADADGPRGRRCGSRSTAGPTRDPRPLAARSSPSAGTTLPDARAIRRSTPLPPPAVRTKAGGTAIEQTFPPDPLFPDGFRYLMAPIRRGDARSSRSTGGPTGEARLHILPQPRRRDGCLVVAVAVSSDPGGPRRAGPHRARLVGEPARRRGRAMGRREPPKAAEFWSPLRRRASPNPLLENLWYETLHARRCTYRRGTVPPGLFLPSTVQDYSHWHGDYHTNYNFQEPFWGDYTANQSRARRRLFRGDDVHAPDRPEDRQRLLRLPRRVHPALGYPIQRRRRLPGRRPDGPHGLHDRLGDEPVLVALPLHARQRLAAHDRLSGDPRLRPVLHRLS